MDVHCSIGHFWQCVIVSPLTALMQDQVSKFRMKGLRAAYVGGEEEKGFDSVMNGDVQLVYLSPESVLSQTHWREMFKTPCYHDNLVCLAVDEAHLVEKWYVRTNCSCTVHSYTVICMPVCLCAFCCLLTNYL